MILKARAAKGPLSSAGRSASVGSSSPLPAGTRPVTGGTSSGEGSSSTTASSSGCTPLFLNEEPQRTGVTLVSRQARCRDLAIRSWGISSSAEVGLHQLVVVVGAGLDQLGPVFLGLVLRGRRGSRRLELGAELVLPDQRLHLDQVDDADEVALAADRQLDRQRVGAEAVRHRLDRVEEVGAGAVHLVDVGEARDLVLVGLAPDGLRLRLDAGDGVEDGDRAVEDAQAALDLDREVDVAGRVDDVDPVAVPLAGGRGGGDRDAALLLLFHPVHDGGALVDLADFVGAAGVVEDALGRRRLTGVDVRHDPDVAGFL